MLCRRPIPQRRSYSSGLLVSRWNLARPRSQMRGWGPSAARGSLPSTGAEDAGMDVMDGAHTTAAGSSPPCGAAVGNGSAAALMPKMTRSGSTMTNVTKWHLSVATRPMNLDCMV